MIRLLALLAVFIVSACSRESRATTDYQPREGDFLFQSLPHNDLIDAMYDTVFRT